MTYWYLALTFFCFATAAVSVSWVRNRNGDPPGFLVARILIVFLCSLVWPISVAAATGYAIADVLDDC
jgi:hypothetical protein